MRIRRTRPAAVERHLTWHELVLPPAKDSPSRANPARTHARREERGQVVPYTGKIIVQAGNGHNRESRRRVHGYGYNPGRLVQHRTRLHPVDGGARSDVLARRARRAKAVTS